MHKHLEEKFCRDLSEKTKRDITLSEQSFYSGEQSLLYKRLVIDGRETRHHVDIMNLRDYGDRNRVSEKTKALAEILLPNQGE